MEIRQLEAFATIDVAITCGLVPDVDGLVNEVFCAEPLLVGLRPDHRLADAATVELSQLEHEVLGVPGPVPRVGAHPAAGPGGRRHRPAGSPPGER